jgi:N-formylglutamate amidohydrolase
LFGGQNVLNIRAEMLPHTPPFSIAGPEQPDQPVVLSVPHAGRAYPPDLHLWTRARAPALVALEDRHADALVDVAVEAGFTAIVATAPRLMIDLNRAEDEIDPHLLIDPVATGRPQSAKVRGGLGLVPRRTAAAGEIWARKLSRAELEARIAGWHRPFHRRVTATLDMARRRFGAAVLLDVHSMPPVPVTAGSPAPDVVVGDRFGRSAATHIVDCAAETLRAVGLRVAINAPYAGGHILETHGRRDAGVHALQIEFDRRLYLDAGLREIGPGIDTARATLLRLARALADEAAGGGLAIAAE